MSTIKKSPQVVAGIFVSRKAYLGLYEYSTSNFNITHNTQHN